MNFLAHLYLSGDDDFIGIGNFIGDFVKGSEFNNYSPKIQQGIKLHRSIDNFTDTHPIVQESKNKLRKKYRHYAGVIVDIYYDHFLAVHWLKYHNLPLRDYVNNQYDLLTINEELLPKKTRQMLPFMISHDWLYNYQYFEGIQQVMYGMSRRTKFNSLMEESVVELKQYYNLFEEEFFTFFPELIGHSKSFLAST